MQNKLHWFLNSRCQQHLSSTTVTIKNVSQHSQMPLKRKTIPQLRNTDVNKSFGQCCGQYFNQKMERHRNEGYTYGTMYARMAGKTATEDGNCSYYDCICYPQIYPSANHLFLELEAPSISPLEGSSTSWEAQILTRFAKYYVKDHLKREA